MLMREVLDFANRERFLSAEELFSRGREEMSIKYKFIDHTTDWESYLKQSKEKDKKKNNKKGSSSSTTTRKVSNPVTKTRTRNRRRKKVKLTLGDKKIVNALRDLKVQTLDRYPYKTIRSQVGMMARGIDTKKLENADTRFYISSFKRQTYKKQEELLDHAFPNSV